MLTHMLLRAVRSPRRADLVAALGETTGAAALSNMLARMQSSPSGRQILAQRPRITVRRACLAANFIAGQRGCRGCLQGLRGFVSGDDQASGECG